MTVRALGLGLSSNLSRADAPEPYGLLRSEPGAFDFVEYSAPLDLETARREASLFDEMWRRREEVPVLFHPVHLNLFGPELESPERLRSLEVHARAVGSPWVSNDVGWWHAGGEPFPGYLYVAPPMSPEGLAGAVVHARHVQRGLSLPLLLENPALFAARGPLHILDFMARLSAETGAELLLDLGHLYSHQLALGSGLLEGLEGFPFEKVREIHIAGGLVQRSASGAVYLDDHTQPIRDELFQLLETVRPRCQNLLALTYEADGHAEATAKQNLRRLRPFAPAKGTPLALERAEGPPGEISSLDPAGDWSLFDWVHREGVEAAVRAAVLRERLDRPLPMTRLLAAPDHTALVRFQTSPDFRAVFEAGGKGLSHGFLAWGRKELRQCEWSDALAAAMAFEVWAQSTLSHAATHPSALAPNAAVGRFAVDLSEALQALAPLRRGRERDAAESLAQLIRRAAPGAWRVLLQQESSGLSVTTVGQEAFALLQDASRTASREALFERHGRENVERATRLGWLRG